MNRANQAIELINQGRLNEAETIYREILSKPPVNASHCINLGIICKQTNRLEEAIKLFIQAISIDNTCYLAFYNLANTYKLIKEFNKAIDSYKKSLSLKHDFVLALYNLANLYREIGSYGKAIELYQKVLLLDSNFVDAINNLGVALYLTGAYDDAMPNFLRAHEINPNSAEYIYNIANIYRQRGEYLLAIENYCKALEIKPQYSEVEVDLIHAESSICSWESRNIRLQNLFRLGLKGNPVSPWVLMSLEDNPFNHLQRARHFYEKKYSRSTTEIDISNNKKIHIGYFSSDFYDHATLHLISKLFELHDKAVFKIYAYSIGSNPSDHYTYHLVSNVEVFRDIHLVDDQSAVSIVRKDNLDIAIDLNGYTKGNRFSIFANRIAPIQINYLGYPGSTGAECIDYLIADKVVIPERFEKYYSEKILYLPNSFQFNHDRREQNHPTLRRSDFGLPESSFVFVCFCANYKITPSVFNVWMRLLKQVDDSVLWLYRSNKWAEINLRRQAESRDIDPERLIFAGRLPLNKHLARHSLADLFLDTFNVNAHTTASDALLAGLPLLTLAGKSFTSRVAASLLVTLNLPELITYTIKDYEEKALMIALDPKLNRRLHEKLKLSIKESALFKPELTTKSLEDIYKELVVKHR